MKSGITLQALASQIQDEQKAKQDYIVPTAQMSLVAQQKDGTYPDFSLRWGEQDIHTLTPICHEQLGGYLEIPRKYYQRLQGNFPGLLEANVNTLLTEKSEKRMVRTLYGQARAFLSSRYRRFDNAQLVEAVMPTLMDVPDMQIQSAQITDRRLYIQAIFPRLEAEVKPGDIVQAGVVISNSEVRYGSVSVETLLYRLVCSNGMIVPDRSIRRRHIGKHAEGNGEGEGDYTIYSDETLRADDYALTCKLRDTIQAATTEAGFLQTLQGIRTATEQQLTADPIQAVEVLSTEYLLQEPEKMNVMKFLLSGNDLSRWGIANAITRASAEVESYDRAVELERMGGQLIQDGPTWSRLNRAN